MASRDDRDDPERAAFLASIAEDEDDEMRHLVYADWLEGHGEYEESERQRVWCAAKRRLVTFAAEQTDSYEKVTYEDLIRIGREAIDEGLHSGGEYLVSCGDLMILSGRLNQDSQEFWRDWSIVTGVMLPEGIAEKSLFSCEC